MASNDVGMRRRSNDIYSKYAGHEDGVVSLKAGWQKIKKHGIDPFLARVENIDSKQFTQKSIPSDEFLSTYDTIFTMCIQRDPNNYSEPLYNKHTEALTNYYKDQCVPILAKKKDEHAYSFLREWVKRWQCSKWAVDGMCRMFMYLDRFYVPNSEDLLCTSERGYTLFRDQVFSPHFKVIARSFLLQCIEDERNGQPQDRDLLRQAINIFVELGQKLKKVEKQIYREDFQAELIMKTAEYYMQTSRRWMDEDSCPAYLVKAEQSIGEELSRLSSYIDSSSKDEMMTATREQLLKVHQTELLSKSTGIRRILARTDTQDAKAAKADLSRLYDLYAELPDGLQPIADAVKNYIQELGLNFIEKSKSNKTTDREHQLVRSLIDLHDQFLNIVKVSFQADQIFHKALKEAFEEFINKEYYVSNLLAKYINDLLKRGTSLIATDLDKTMDHVVNLYGYIRDKDIFERDYQIFLANRLLQDLSASEQNEKTMIGKLKNEAGYHWTSKLEGMFKDRQRSRELMNDFDKTSIDIDIDISVCTTGAWPSSNIVQCTIPKELTPAIDTFKQYYLKLHGGRKLSFRCDLGKAEVAVKFAKDTTKTLVVSTYQMMTLLCFNEKKVVTFKEIKAKTHIPNDALAVHIQSLAHPKIKILRKRPNSKEVSDDHQFMINPKYTNPRNRIIIPLLQRLGKHQNATMNAQDEAIKNLRRHQMDAAIVRIMKARKTQKHPDLVAEVVKQLKGRFAPSGTDIKKRITSLIDLEYLMRDDNERATYHYKM